MTAIRTAAATRIAERIATARDLAQALAPAAFEPLEETHLVALARRTYARAAIWNGEDAALLADDAEQLANEEQAEYDGEPIEPEDVEGVDAPAERLEEVLQHLTRSGVPAEPQDPERVRALYVETLASLMHAAQAAHGSPYAIYDAHEPFADIHHDPRD
ncbi:hypothetical protein [Nocardiopsis deserti]|uniref:hypothetical protein n=1 Tax=Nocardiopsis deserti TaxID=2605988 RepID=UPI001238D9AE|nr:hypothetical protein [Nocardiopsis deserti]